MSKNIYLVSFLLLVQVSLFAQSTLLEQAEQGNVSAQIMIGEMYYTGEGVTQNYKEAFKWFYLAGMQGNINAQVQIGIMYLEGEGEKQDYMGAWSWFRLAAEQGNSVAQGQLSLMNFYGYAVDQSYVMALQWCILALTNPEEQNEKNLLEFRDTLTGMMTKKQIREAKKGAREFKPQKWADLEKLFTKK